MKLFPSKEFVKCVKKLFSSKQQQVKSKLKLMQVDIYRPSLRTKKIKSVEGLFESSINMDTRIIWTYVKEGILLLKCVVHDDLKKL